MIADLRSRFSKELPSVALIMLCVACIFWPIWLLGYRFPVGGGDLWGQLHPVWNYVADWLRRGVFPLWCTRMMAGDPIISEMQYGLLNPLNWLMFLLNPEHPWVISARAIASLVTAAVGSYAYLRASPVWRLHRPAALIGAIAYASSDPFIVHLGHPQFNDTMAWLPWTLLGIDFAVSAVRFAPWLGLSVAMLIVAGHGQAALYALALITAYALWRSLARPLGLGWQPVGLRLARLALAAMLAACLSAPAVLPALERLPYTERASLPAGQPEYEFPAAMLLDLVSPAIHGRSSEGFWPPWDRVESPYIGAAALTLAALGILLGLRKPGVMFMALAGVTATLYALGTRGPLYPLVRNLPLLSATWKTSRAIFLLSFALTCIAAEGAERLLVPSHPSTRGRTRRIWSLIVVVSGGVLLVAAPLLASQIPAGAPQAGAIKGLRLAGLAWAGVGLAAALSTAERRTRAALLAIVAIEAIAANALVDVEPLPRAETDPHLSSLAYLRADTGWFRVDVDSRARGLWSPAALMAEGFDIPQGTGNPMELVVYTQYYWGIPSKGHPAYSQLGAKFIIVPKGAQPGGEGIWPVFWDDPLIDIHLNTHALPRIWLVYTTVPVATLEEAYAITARDDFAPELLATVQDGPRLEELGQGTLEVLAYGPNRVAVHVETSEPAMLVLSDLSYPGWIASIDGERTTLYKANGIFRGVEVPAGTHRVEMRFLPTSFAVGLGLAGLAILALLAGGWVSQRRQSGAALGRRLAPEGNAPQ